MKFTPQVYKSGELSTSSFWAIGKGYKYHISKYHYSSYGHCYEELKNPVFKAYVYPSGASIDKAEHLTLEAAIKSAENHYNQLNN